MNIGYEILNRLKDEIPNIEYNRYIKQLSYDEKRSSSDRAIYIAPNTLVANYIKTKYSDKLIHLFEVKTSNKVVILITTKEAKKNIKKVEQKSVDKTKHSLLNPSHTFDILAWLVQILR